MKKSQIVRIVELDRWVRSNKYPNRTHLSIEQEVNERTVARDVEFLRDRLKAPLEYDPLKRGYYYTKPWTFPSVLTLSAYTEDRLTKLIEEVKSLTTAERDRLRNMLLSEFPEFAHAEFQTPRHAA